MGKTKILLVEDDKNINKLITDYMTTHGFEVTSFEDGPERLITSKCVVCLILL